MEKGVKIWWWWVYLKDSVRDEMKALLNGIFGKKLRDRDNEYIDFLILISPLMFVDESFV